MRYKLRMGWRSVFVVALVACSNPSSDPQPTPIVAPPAAAVTPLPATLSATDKTYGAATFWKEASYNFAYFDQVPDLDWNRAFTEALSRIATTTDDLAYYRELQRLSARLDDGHTNVFLPLALAKLLDWPAITLDEIEGRPVVTNVGQSLRDQLPVGSIVIQVDRIAVATRLETEVLPLVSANPPMRRRLAIRGQRGTNQIGLLVGRAGSELELQVETPTGELRTICTTRTRAAKPEPWVVPVIEPAPLTIAWQQPGIALVGIHTFMSPQLAAQFAASVTALRGARGIVIDLRDNGGGDEGIAMQIMNHLTTRPYRGSAWRTRKHVAAYKAWGSSFTGLLEYGAYARGDAWIEEAAPVTTPPAGAKISAPIVVLIGRDTASSAENFLIMLDSVQRAELVGEPTYGSTGQPLPFELPGGGGARVCTKGEQFPDGRKFVGFGVQPHVRVDRTLAAVREGRDPVMERGVDVLMARLNAGRGAPPILQTPAPTTAGQK